MKKFILSCVGILFLCGQAFGATPANMRIPSLEPPKLRAVSDRSLEETLKALPPGLTFYKDFTRIPPGTYKQSGLLDADFSLGSPVATFTSTSGSFTITSNGYNATVANDEVLSYLISGNRTAATETIVIVFTPTGDFANDGNYRYLVHTSDGDGLVRKATTGRVLYYAPQGGAGYSGATTLLDATTYTTSFINYRITGNPNSQIILNGSVDGTQNTDYTLPTFGTYMFFGVSRSGDCQMDGYIAYILVFNRGLSASEYTQVYNIIK